MNQRFHNKRQWLTVTDKQAGVGKLVSWSKKFYWSHVQDKIRGKVIKWASNLCRLKYSGQKLTRGQCAPPADRAKEIILPSMKSLREELKVLSNFPALLVMAAFQGQMTKAFDNLWKIATFSYHLYQTIWHISSSHLTLRLIHGLKTSWKKDTPPGMHCKLQ